MSDVAVPNNAKVLSFGVDVASASGDEIPFVVVEFVVGSGTRRTKLSGKIIGPHQIKQLPTDFADRYFGQPSESKIEEDTLAFLEPETKKK